MSAFGKGTIRKFGANVSAMKKLAARDLEDILQVRHLHNEYTSHTELVT